MAILKCERCGKEAARPAVHVDPDGWERDGMGNDICDECWTFFLKVLQQHAAREKTK